MLDSNKWKHWDLVWGDNSWADWMWKVQLKERECVQMIIRLNSKYWM
jgi:hypothetical protein